MSDTTPTLADLIRTALAALLATVCLPEAAEQLREGTLRWRTAAELLLAWAYRPTMDDRTPGRLYAAARAADAMGRGDVEGAAGELARAEGVTAESWALIALDRWQGPRCEGCDQAYGTDEAAERAGCLKIGGGWVVCADCRSIEPDPEPPPPAPRRAPRPAPVRTDVPTPAAAELVATVGAVTSPAAAVAWAVERDAQLAALPRAERDAVRTALARRVVDVGSGGTKSLSAARNYLTREIDLALRAAASAPAEAPSDVTETATATATPPRELVLVPDAIDPAAEALEAFARDVAAITLPGQAAAVWIHHRGALPRGERDAAERRLAEHIENVGNLGRGLIFLRRSVADCDGRMAIDPSLFAEVA